MEQKEIRTIQKKFGIGLSAYHQIECLNNSDAVEKLAAQEKFQVGKPCLMKALEVSKSIEVTPEQNPILLVACAQKNGIGKICFQRSFRYANFYPQRTAVPRRSS